MATNLDIFSIDLINSDQSSEKIETELISRFEARNDDNQDLEATYYTISNLIGAISDSTVLQRTVNYLRRNGYLNQPIGRLSLKSYNEQDRIKILATIYSIRFYYQFQFGMNDWINSILPSSLLRKNNIPENLPKLSIFVEGRSIRHNMLEVVLARQLKVSLYDKMLLENLPKPEAEKVLKTYISDINDRHFITGHPFYGRMIEFFKNELISLPNHSASTIVQPAHTHVFSNNGFKLFSHILENYVSIGRGRKADIAHYYWLMFENKPPYIHQRPESFKSWFFEQYGEDLGKFRTLAALKNSDRKNNYLKSVDWLNSSLG